MRLPLAAVVVGACGAYKVALVEYSPEPARCQSAGCGLHARLRAISEYHDFASQATRQGADLVVFPEYGLTGECGDAAWCGKQYWLNTGYTDLIPEAAIGSNLCNETQGFGEDAPVVKGLSCAAAAAGITIVANLLERSADGRAVFNTNVAVDADGTLLARYRKLNLWGETAIDVPKKCEIVSFTPRFGEKIGLATCADLIYQHPLHDLVDSGVKNFVVPVAWSNELAQMQVLAYAQGWSAVNGVNLVVVNQNARSTSGSAVFSSGRPVLSNYWPARGASRLFVTELSTGESSGLQQTPAVGNALHRFALHRLGFANEKWSFARLSDGKVCSGDVCCSVSGIQGSESGYVIAALQGGDQDYSVHWPATVCAVLPCQTLDANCLWLQQPTLSTNLKGLQLHATGIDTHGAVPEVMATKGVDNPEVLLTPGQGENAYSFHTSDSAKTVSLEVGVTDWLLSATIYGRPFSEDTLPYSCPDEPRNSSDGKGAIFL
eukprot:TRINITY_DN80934_c0_g1_i1.p1 TRINITY_DN80934_c0_g1~~TRINITY_DN80934_c0_g1_i1.p1  ORF type:complete len:491 (-),score=80.82 TRINITY_DN80934_c0_g1_i1:40-1512(-)